MSINAGLAARYMRAYVSAMTASATAKDSTERMELFRAIAAELPMPHVNVETHDDGQLHLGVDLSELFLAAVVLLNYLLTTVSEVTGVAERPLITDLGIWVAENFPEDDDLQQ